MRRVAGVVEVEHQGLTRFTGEYPGEEELRVGPGDMGRVIGRQGRVVNAMRALVQLCAARDGRRAQLEIID